MDKIGLYIHWPYCARICPYCDFNIYKNKPAREDELVDAILTDMTYWRAQSRPRHLASAHFGGGTPSLLSSDNMGRIIQHACALWEPQADLEIGLEANPNDITKARLEVWRAAGIERLSIGVQSFDDDVLKFLGRDHSGAQAQSALRAAAQIMPRVSADLIYGWAGQSLTHWRHELSTALNAQITHISAYQLTIEDSTAFARAEARGQARAVDGDTSADLYELGLELLGGAGFDQYEISNFAKTDTARSQHNLLYWQGEDYIGVGPGAHGRLTRDDKRLATIAALKPDDYIMAVNSTGNGVNEAEPLTPESRAQEYLLMGLRISKGINLRRYEQMCGKALPQEVISHYAALGLLTHTKDRLAATPAGRLVLDKLSHELLS